MDVLAKRRVMRLPERKRIALIAHDNCKTELLEWALFNRGTLAGHDLFVTGTTGERVRRELELPVTRFVSGPLGGDQQVGAAIVEGRLDLVIFFWDPLEPHPHDVDVKALLRMWSTTFPVQSRDRRFPSLLTVAARPIRAGLLPVGGEGQLHRTGGTMRPRIRDGNTTSAQLHCNECATSRKRKRPGRQER